MKASIKYVRANQKSRAMLLNCCRKVKYLDAIQTIRDSHFSTLATPQKRQLDLKSQTRLRSEWFE